MNWGRRSSWLPFVSTIILTMACGCRWLPLRSDSGSSANRQVATKVSNPESELPPLPALQAISDDEAFRPSTATPILDAAAERDEAVRRAMASKVLPASIKAIEPPAIPESPPDAPVSRSDSEVEPTKFDPPKVEATTEVVPVVESQDISEIPLWEYVLTAIAVETNPDPESELLQPEPPHAVTPIFAISDLRICKRVTGFGRTEPILPEALVPGSQILLYCEIDGVHDEECPEGFRSKIASSVAILSVSGETPVWQFDLGSAEDLCRRRRRDFFVNYRVTIPASLRPGDYLVRLVQKDLLAGHESSRTLPLTVRAK